MVRNASLRGRSVAARIVAPSLPRPLQAILELRPVAGMLYLNPFPSDGLAAGRTTFPGRKPQAMDEFTEMDDPEFLAERRKVRDELEGSPEDEQLLRRYAAIDAEFLRRAGLAWAQAS
jgi:hypothetical protein